MLNLQKSASNQTSLGYDFSSSNIASANTTIFAPPANNVETENNEVKNELANENIDKGKSILGAPPKLAKNETKNLRAKKGNSQKPKQKKATFLSSLWHSWTYSSKLLQMASHSKEQQHDRIE